MIGRIKDMAAIMRRYSEQKQEWLRSDDVLIRPKEKLDALVESMEERGLETRAVSSGVVLGPGAAGATHNELVKAKKDCKRQGYDWYSILEEDGYNLPFDVKRSVKNSNGGGE